MFRYRIVEGLMAAVLSVGICLPAGLHRAVHAQNPASDLDGDGIADLRDPKPYVADIPQVRIVPQEFSFYPDYEFESERTHLTISSKTHRDKTVTLQHHGASSDTTAEFTSYVNPLTGVTPPTGRVSTKLNTTHSVQMDRSKVRETAKESQTTTVIKETKGKWKMGLTIKAVNLSQTECTVSGFTVNVFLNNVLLITARATPMHLTGEKLTLLPNRPGDVSQVVFTITSSHMIQKLQNTTKSPVVTVKILSGSYAVAQKKKAVNVQSVRSQCALLNINDPDRPHSAWVSVAPDPDEKEQGECTIDRLLRRYSGAGKLLWGQGPFGDYLRQFDDRVGGGIWLRKRPDEGQWRATLVRAKSGVVNQLSGEWKDTVLRGQDVLSLDYIPPETYWNPLNDGCKSVVDASQPWLNARVREDKFWDIVRAWKPKTHNTEVVPWEEARKAFEESKKANADLAKRFPNYFGNTEFQERQDDFNALIDRSGNFNWPTYHLALARVNVTWINAKGMKGNMVEPFAYVFKPGNDSRNKNKNGRFDFLPKKGWVANAKGGGKVDLSIWGKQAPPKQQAVWINWQPFQPIRVELSESDLFRNEVYVRYTFGGFDSAKQMIEGIPWNGVDVAGNDIVAEESLLRVVVTTLDGPGGHRNRTNGVTTVDCDQWLKASLPYVVGTKALQAIFEQPARAAESLRMHPTPERCYQAKWIFAQLFRHHRGDTKPELAQQYLRKAVECAMLAHDFASCENLGKLLSDSEGPGLVEAKLIAAAGRDAQKLAPDSNEFGVLARGIRDWRAVRRFETTRSSGTWKPPDVLERCDMLLKTISATELALKGVGEESDWARFLTNKVAELRSRIEKVRSEAQE